MEVVLTVAELRVLGGDEGVVPLGGTVRGGERAGSEEWGAPGEPTGSAERRGSRRGHAEGEGKAEEEALRSLASRGLMRTEGDRPPTVDAALEQILRCRARPCVVVFVDRRRRLAIAGPDGAVQRERRWLYRSSTGTGTGTGNRLDAGGMAGTGAGTVLEERVLGSGSHAFGVRTVATAARLLAAFADPEQWAPTGPAAGAALGAEEADAAVRAAAVLTHVAAFRRLDAHRLMVAAVLVAAAPSGVVLVPALPLLSPLSAEPPPPEPARSHPARPQPVPPEPAGTALPQSFSSGDGGTPRCRLAPAREVVATMAACLAPGPAPSPSFSVQ